MASATRRSTRCRSNAGSRRVVPKALTAAAMAASACSRRALHHSSDYAAIVWGADLDDVAIISPAAVDKKTVGRDWGNCHLCHGVQNPLVPTGLEDYRPRLSVPLLP